MARGWWMTTGAAVSAQLRVLARRLEKDAELRERLAGAETRLERQSRKERRV